MNNLIEALKIFEKYIGDKEYPTWAERNTFGVNCPIDGMSEEDIKKLEELGFFWEEAYESFISFRYGSC